MLWSCSILTVFVGVYCISNDIVVPCKKQDWDCMTQTAKQALPKIAVGIPSLGIESMDPLHIERIEGNLSELKFTLTDCVVNGLKNCDVNNVKLDLDNLYMRFNLACANIAEKGNYKIKGRLSTVPVEGDGKFQVYLNKYEIGFEAQLKRIKNSESKDVLEIQQYKYNVKAIEKVSYDFTNLFTGEKMLAVPVLQFANSNLKEVVDFVQGPIVEASSKKFIENINKFMKTLPIDEIVL